MIAALQRRELSRVAGQLSEELAKPFVEPGLNERIEGRFTRTVDMASGRYAPIERARDFTLVPWRPVIDRHVGKPVSGIMRERGRNWKLGSQRSGPSISQLLDSRLSYAPAAQTRLPWARRPRVGSPDHLR